MSSFTAWFYKKTSLLEKKPNFSNLEEKFQKCFSDSQRIQTLLEHKDSFDEIIHKKFAAKCKKKSEEARTLGNKEYGKMQLKQALQSYTQGIIFAEHSSLELALAYGNRSTVLFSTKDYDLAQADIMCALENNYPSEKRYKLYGRLGKCYLELSVYVKATQAFEDCLNSLEDSVLNKDESGFGKKKAEIESLLDECKDNFLCSNLTVENSEYFSKAPVLMNKNQVYPSCSDAFKIISSENQGRFAVASRAIEPGDIIAIEKAFSSVCLPECYETHCYECLTRFKVAHPCRNCVSVRYCSTQCETTSWKNFHQFECNHLGLLTNADVGLGHLAVKMIVQTGVDKLNSFVEYGGDGLDADGIYNASDYGCVYSLVGNSRYRSKSDLFRRSLMALFLGKILVQGEFMAVENLQVVCTHLLKQIQMLPCNAHEVSEYRVQNDDKVENGELVEIASAAYTTLSLLNHACDPSVVRHCYGDTCVVRAIKHIAEGEEIVDNYGFLYPVEEHMERQHHLMEQYYFKCRCHACSSDWPLYNDLEEKMPSFECNVCREVYGEDGKCSKCGTKDEEVAVFQLSHVRFLNSMKNVLETSNARQNLPSLLKYLDLISRKAQLPVIHFNNCQEVVKLCFSLQGNCIRLKD